MVRAKKAGEDLLFDYGNQVGTKVLINRFPNVFGKCGRPNYNSSVATFCIYPHDLPINVNDPGVIYDLVYIDDWWMNSFMLLKERKAGGVTSVKCPS